MEQDTSRCYSESFLHRSRIRWSAQTYSNNKVYRYTYMYYVGVVSRRCIGNDEWEEMIGCFNEEAEDLLNQVISISLLHI